MRIALGGVATGVFTNSTELYESLKNAGTFTGDRVWRFPLWQHFNDMMTSRTFFFFFFTIRYFIQGRNLQAGIKIKNKKKKFFS